jgi:hypothetical protein
LRLAPGLLIHGAAELERVLFPVFNMALHLMFAWLCSPVNGAAAAAEPPGW